MIVLPDLAVALVHHPRGLAVHVHRLGVGLQQSDGGILERLARVRERALQATRQARTMAELDSMRRAVIGKAGTLLEVRCSIGALTAPEDRKRVGAALGQAQQELVEALRVREQELLDSEPALTTPLDVTLPAPMVNTGGLHPTIQLMYDLNDAFTALNFEVYEGSEISSELFEFDYMNFPPDRPARESMDTYWLDGSSEKSGKDRLCVWSHLTGASVRYMQEHAPPFRFAYPGRVYRNESADARHERAFFNTRCL